MPTPQLPRARGGLGNPSRNSLPLPSRPPLPFPPPPTSRAPIPIPPLRAHTSPAPIPAPARTLHGVSTIHRMVDTGINRRRGATVDVAGCRAP